jgi:hypothetical protein
MSFSLRMILLLVAVVLFVVAALDDAGGDWIAWGLAAFAAAFLVGEAGWDRSFGGTRRT